jgi:peptidoglycan-N-acetylglucosamine deacetylase
MSKAYLTIDDGPTKNTKEFIDFLVSKNIKPIMFFSGEQICKERENGIYAIQKGAVIGNHSYTHPHFSDLNLDECISEIESQEEQIDLLYKEAGVIRKYKLFRFPYGDKGGENKDALQEYLKKNGFVRIDDIQIKYEWYYENKLNKDYDVFWTFDFKEYELEYDNGFTYSDILNVIHDDKPETGGILLRPNVNNIVLIHDHEKTEEVCQNYFYKIINHALENGVEFIEPKFITEN